MEGAPTDFGVTKHPGQWERSNQCLLGLLGKMTGLLEAELLVPEEGRLESREGFPFGHV